MKAYEKWIEEIEDQVQEVARLLENEAFHHASDDQKDRADCYRIVSELARSIAERKERLTNDYRKAQNNLG